MSIVETWQTTSDSLEATLNLAERIGHNLHGGEVIELVSDLGGGKTAFVRGLAAGIDSKDAVRSPSFTLSNQYKGKVLTLYHFDFYRLQEAGIMQQELAELLDDPQAVLAVEWADIIEEVLPESRLQIKLLSIGETSRQIKFTYPKNMEYLLHGVAIT